MEPHSDYSFSYPSLFYLGIISPVTRLSAGREYHQQLARQIVDLLLSNHRLRRLGGMITLSDVYCIYNRARGTELVSPDDLLEAAQMLNKLQIGNFKSSFYISLCLPIK